MEHQANGIDFLWVGGQDMMHINYSICFCFLSYKWQDKLKKIK